MNSLRTISGGDIGSDIVVWKLSLNLLIRSKSYQHQNYRMGSSGLEENQRDKDRALFLEMHLWHKGQKLMGNMDPNNSELKCDQESWTLNMKIFRNSLLSLVYIFLFSQEWHMINLYQNKSKIML